MATKPTPATDTGPLERALALLGAFVDGQPHWGVRELAAAMNEPASTTQRLLARLRDLGWLDYDVERKRYGVGVELLRIGAVLGARHPVLAAAPAIVERLAARARATAWLCLYDSRRQRVACLLGRAGGDAAVPFVPPIGLETAIADDPAGWAVLAGLPAAEAAPKAGRHAQRSRVRGVLADALAAARAQGYAEGLADAFPGVTLLASSVRTPAGLPCGSLVVALPNPPAAARARELGALLREHAATLEERLRGTLLAGARTGSWSELASFLVGTLERDTPGLALITSPGGGASNLDDVRSGRAAYGLTTVASLAAALQRKPAREPAAAGAVAALSRLHLHVYTRRDAAPLTLESLRSLRVSPGAQGFSSGELFEALLGGRRAAVAGNALYLDYPEGARLLLAGRLDAVFWLTSRDNPVCLELAASPAVRVEALPGPVLSDFAARHPGYRVSRIAMGGRRVATLETQGILVAHGSRADDEVYRLARALHRLRAVPGSQSRAMPPPADITGLPVHPGAARYWASLARAMRRAQAAAQATFS